MQQNVTKQLTSIFADLALIALIAVVGWFLTGYYWQIESIRTGYPDWVFHAFRIKTLMNHGFASWDNVWSNGINYWRAYQYVGHVLTLLVASALNLSITRTMILLMGSIFILSRVTLYILMRCLRYPPVLSTLITIVTYTMSQQWVGVKDFSVFFFIGLFPIFIAIWIKAFSNTRWLYLLVALAGAMWSLHPVMGYMATGLVGFYYLFSVPRRSVWQFIGMVLVYLVSSAPFTVSYFSSGYHFTNPIYATSQFARETIAGGYWGLSLYYIIGLALCWILTFVYTGQINRWSKILLLFCTVYLLAVGAVQGGYVLGFINQLQISRGTLLLGFILPFVFVDYFASIMKRNNRLVLTVEAVVLALLLTRSVTTASEFMGDPVDRISSPVATFFQTHDLPSGSIYIEQLAEASYLAKSGIRFITSYNEHLEPSPLSLRFKKFLKNDVIYTGISASQADLLGAYTDVLGVEYLFLSKTSPIAEYLVGNDALKGQFEELETADFRVIRNTHPIHYAYLVDNSKVEEISLKELKKPNLLADSYLPWDEEMVRLRQLLGSEAVKPVDLEFKNTNELLIPVSQEAKSAKKGLLIFQHYDNFWQTPHENVTIMPTSLRFMYIPDLSRVRGESLNLINSWPWWYWPVQSLGLITVSSTGLGTLAAIYISNKKKS